VTGTLGVLDLAAQRGLVNSAEAANRLRRTSFGIPERVSSPSRQVHTELNVLAVVARRE
jgi:hypothetical protein